MTAPKGRREWRVSWLREGNSQARTKRCGTSEKRARSYLAAVTAASPEERYGDKVDERWCCEGHSGDGVSEPIEPCHRNCRGQTWREKWNDAYGSMPPLVWAKIESRPVNPWGTVQMIEPDTFRFGDILKMKDEYIRSASTVAKIKSDRRLMAIDSRTGVVLVPGVRGHKEERGSIQRIGIGIWEKVE